MVIVAEEHVIEGSNFRCAERRAREFSKYRPSRWIFPAGRIEGRISKQPSVAEFEHGGWAAEIGEAEDLRWHPNFGFNRMATGFAWPAAG